MGENKNLVVQQSDNLFAVRGYEGRLPMVYVGVHSQSTN